MISVIISTRNPVQLQQVSDSVGATIGVAHEIVPVENQNRRYSLCEAYNIGAEKAAFDVLCFVHEDVLFRTPNWGGAVTRILDDASVGLLGVAGRAHWLNAPISWNRTDPPSTRIHIVQHRKAGPPTLEYVNPAGEQLAEVAVVDGVWMACRRTVWEQNRFDESVFPNFHFYDLDFSLQIRRRLRVCVTYEVLLEHFSEGKYDREWIDNALAFHRKWRKALPVRASHLHPEQIRKYTLENYHSFIRMMIKNKYDKIAVLRFLLKCYALSGLKGHNPALLKSVGRYLVMDK